MLFRTAGLWPAHAHEARETRAVRKTMTPPPATRGGRHVYSCNVRSRRALLMTLTEESAIAAAAMTGDSRMPKLG